MKIPLTITLLCLCYLVSGELSLQDVEIPDIDDFAVIKEKCDILGGNGTYNTLKAKKDTLQTCLQGFVDFNVLKNEVEEAKKTGSMDEVFGKYCAKRPTLSSCTQTFINALRPCLNAEEKKALNITLDILKQLGEFVCFRDGDRIAMFVAEGGVECIQDHAEGIKNCLNSTFKINPTVNTNSLPNLLIDKKKCDDLGKLQNCVVEELEKCKDSTPANIIDALFRFIKRSACSNKNKRSIHRMFKRSVAVANNFYNTAEAKNRAIKIIKEKCAQNAPEGGYDAFTKSLNNATVCIKEKTLSDPIFVTPRDEFKDNIYFCVKDLIQKTRNCMPIEEKYWPQFQYDISSNLIDFTYKNKDQMSLQSSRTELVNCFQNFKQQDAKNEISKCFQDSENEESLSKEIICTRFRNAKTCVSEQLKKRCIREITITKLNNELFDAIIAPCSKSY